jgi:hypothetical protein
MQPVHSADSTMLEHPQESQCPGMPSAEIATADKCPTSDRTVNTSRVNTSPVNTTPPSPPPLCRYTSSVLHVHTVDKNSPLPPTIIPPSTLYDSLSPKLLHQQSLHTAVQQLLLPIAHLPSIPIDILTKLHAVLRDSPRLLTYLPPLPPVRPRSLRAPPPVSYADPDQPQIGPPPLSPAFPFGTQDGVGIAPSTLTTLGNDAGMGLIGLQPKCSHYTKNAKYRQLFARKGDYKCS